jgi:hypothetical protein
MLSDNLRELITFSGLDDTIKNQDVSVVGGLENKNVLVQRLLDVKDFLDLDGHSCSSKENRKKKFMVSRDEIYARFFQLMLPFEWNIP